MSAAGLFSAVPENSGFAYSGSVHTGFAYGGSENQDSGSDKNSRFLDWEHWEVADSAREFLSAQDRAVPGSFAPDRAVREKAVGSAREHLSVRDRAVLDNFALDTAVLDRVVPDLAARDRVAVPARKLVAVQDYAARFVRKLSLVQD